MNNKKKINNFINNIINKNFNYLLKGKIYINFYYMVF